MNMVRDNAMRASNWFVAGLLAISLLATPALAVPAPEDYIFVAASDDYATSYWIERNSVKVSADGQFRALELVVYKPGLAPGTYSKQVKEYNCSDVSAATLSRTFHKLTGDVIAEDKKRTAFQPYPASTAGAAVVEAVCKFDGHKDRPSMNAEKAALKSLTLWREATVAEMRARRRARNGD